MGFSTGSGVVCGEVPGGGRARSVGYAGRMPAPRDLVAARSRRLMRAVLGGLLVALSVGGAWAQAVATPPTDKNLVVVHYHRFDGDYERAGMWVWDGREQKTPTNGEVLAAGRTDYGVFFVIDRAKYGNDDSDKERIGFIPRLRQDWNAKDGGDRFWTPEMGREVWLIGTDPKIYRTRPSTAPKIAAAGIDRLDLITVKLSGPVAESAVAGLGFGVKNKSGRAVPITSARAISVENGKTMFVELKLEESLKIGEEDYVVGATGYEPREAVLRKVKDDATRFSTDLPLGAIYSKKATTFRLFSPLAREVFVRLYDSATADKETKELPMKSIAGGAWEATVDGDLEGKFYKFHVASHQGNYVANDPYATNTTGADGNARITDIRAQDPEGFRPVTRPKFGGRPTDAVIYEIHIRDLTIMAEGGVDADKRGKYLGFVQPGTRLTTDSKIKTGIDHLKELGVTHVQILPFQDFDNAETSQKSEYNWGYMTAFFNSPEGWFASSFRDAARIREAKAMIKALKDANIGVIMDVVYNHTGNQSTFEMVSPGYYHRMKDDGSYWNGSGTGNEFRTEGPMVRKFLVDSLKYWVDEYGVDGFRFDLMGLMDMGSLQAAAKELRALYPEILLYGEPWAAAESGLGRITDKGVVKGSGLSAFNDSFRNSIKGAPDGPEPGYVQDGRNRGGVINGITGSIDDWTAEPWESINYVTCHDNLTLWDKLKLSAPGRSDAEYRAMQNLSMGILAVSQGVLFFHGGEELARTKYGEHNSYNKPDSINQVEWPRKAEYADVVAFHQGIIALRRAHPVFRLASAAEVRERIRFYDHNRPSENSIIFGLNGQGVAGETWKEVVVFINPEGKELEFSLPSQGEYDVYVNGAKAGVKAMGKAEGKVKVAGKSMAVLAR